jgi:lactate dehydrogenase-like 2-hydroxyacid dehydrogenase
MHPHPPRDDGIVPRFPTNTRESAREKLAAPGLRAASRLGLKVVGITSRNSVDHFDELHPQQQLREAVAGADFLVLLVPYSPETHHLIDASVLAAM